MASAPRVLLAEAISVPGQPFAALPSRDGQWLFVSITKSAPNESSGVQTIAIGDQNAARTLQLIPIELEGSHPITRGMPAVAGMVTTHDGRMLIATSDDSIVFLDITRIGTAEPPATLGHMRIQRGAYNVQVNITQDDRYLFVSNEGDHSNITVVDLRKARQDAFAEAAIIGRIPTGIAPVALVFSPDDQWLYATSAFGAKGWGWPLKCEAEQPRGASSGVELPEGAILVIDVDKAKLNPAAAVRQRVRAGCSPVRLALSKDGSQLWVTVRKENSVAAYDTERLRHDSDHARVAQFQVGTSPIGIALVSQGRYVVNTNSHRFGEDVDSSQTLTVIDTRPSTGEAYKIAGRVRVGAFPREISVSPDERTMFVTNYYSKSVEIIDVESLGSKLAH